MSQVLAEPQVSLNSFIIHLKPAIDITEDQFFALCQLNCDLRLERNAEGDIIVMPPTGGETGIRNSEINRQLANWTKHHNWSSIISYFISHFDNTRPQAIHVSGWRWIFNCLLNT